MVYISATLVVNGCPIHPCTTTFSLSETLVEVNQAILAWLYQICYFFKITVHSKAEFLHEKKRLSKDFFCMIKNASLFIFIFSFQRRPTNTRLKAFRVNSRSKPKDNQGKLQRSLLIAKGAQIDQTRALITKGVFNQNLLNEICPCFLLA